MSFQIHCSFFFAANFVNSNYLDRHAELTEKIVVWGFVVVESTNLTVIKLFKFSFVEKRVSLQNVCSSHAVGG